uniref:Signal transducer and activator of transcription n=1 Tax=Tetraodon nigroviridis TaxID=99883 RepID=H3DKH4_TETNG
MAQWQKLLSLDSELQDGVTQLYEGKFPRELRHWLCSQIESHNWGLAASDENEANACFHSLLDYLEEQWKRSVQEHSILQGPDFAGMRAYLLKNFQDNPKYLATILFECLEMEKRILDAAAEEQNQPCCGPTLEPNAIQLDGKISDLESLSLEIKKESKSLESSYERLEYMQEACGDQSIAEGMKQVPVQQHVGLARCLANVKEKCRAQADNIAQKKQVLLQNTMKMVKEAEEIVLQLVDEELPEWRRRQRLACVGAPLDTSLDRLQNWFTSVVGTLLELREQLQELQQQDRKYNSVQGSEFSAPLEATEKAAASLCLKLLRSALVVEKQPVMASLPQRPQIVKTGVRFTVSVRFLANLPRFKYQLRVKPEFDKNVEEAGTIKGFRQFRISKDDSKVLDEDTPGGGLVAEFCHMSLKEAKAKVKGTTETRLGVTEELHLVTFVTEFRHAGLECTIEASSLPLVVISSSNQVVSAWASIMWCSALCTGDPANLSLFVEPPPLPWTQLSQLLSWQFLTVGRRQLDPDQLSHLREKFLDGPDQLVHWSQFFKENWIWIDGILELIKKHLVNLWKEGLIMGFVSRKGTKELLRDKENGTFLLRFSESSKEGAITFSWVEHINGETQVHAVQPYTSNELSLMSLPRILHHFNVKSQNCSSGNPLLYLYPRIPKDSVF